jgi:hypothetical protein
MWLVQESSGSVRYATVDISTPIFVKKHISPYRSTANLVLRSSSVVVEALCYKPEGRGFQTRWDECIFLIYLILPAALDPGIDSAYNRNEYQNRKNNVSGE